MDKNQKVIFKGISGLLLITFGLFSDDKFVADLALSGGAALMISGIINMLTQNNEQNEVLS